MVIQTLQSVAGKGLLILDPKTERSRRLIRLPEFVREALKDHLMRRAVLPQNPERKESGPVFTTNIGTPITPRKMLRHFKNKLTSIGLPNVRFHDLRHTTASLLLEKNVHPKMVSEFLGYPIVTLTLYTYSHIISPMSGVAAEAMDEIAG